MNLGWGTSKTSIWLISGSLEVITDCGTEWVQEIFNEWMDKKWVIWANGVFCFFVWQYWRLDSGPLTNALPHDPRPPFGGKWMNEWMNAFTHKVSVKTNSPLLKVMGVGRKHGMWKIRYPECLGWWAGRTRTWGWDEEGVCLGTLSGR
jgi:hypothetical protein